MTRTARSSSSSDRMGRRGNRRTRFRYFSCLARIALPPGSGLTAELVFLPVPFVVFRVREHVPDVQPAGFVIDEGDQAEAVAGDVKDDEPPDHVGGVVAVANVGE